MAGSRAGQSQAVAAGQLAAVQQARHGAACGCHRCRGMQPGNQLARTHGAYCSEDALSQDPAFVPHVDDLRGRLPAYAPSDEPAVQLLGLTLVRIKRATAALDELDRRSASPLSPYLVENAAALQRLRDDLRGWVNTALRLSDALALTPTARARLGLDIVRTEDALDRLQAEGRAVRERREAADRD